MKRFGGEAIQHIYQRSEDGGVIFYDKLDRLLFLFILRHYRQRYDITILGVSVMFNHFHLLVLGQEDDIVNFVTSVTSHFARLYNRESGRRGSLFQKSFGHAEKWSDKYVRNAIAYVYNNHTEKKLCRNVLDMRWNLLAYGFSNNPYSEKIVARKASWQLRKAIKWASYAMSKEVVPDYGLLARAFDSLPYEEGEQLMDFIISGLSLVDYDKLFSFYASPEEMVYAVNSVSGSEYDIEEEKGLGDDNPYLKFLEVVRELGYSTVTKDFLKLPYEEKSKLIVRLMYCGWNLREHVERFLHLNKKG